MADTPRPDAPRWLSDLAAKAAPGAVRAVESLRAVGARRAAGARDPEAPALAEVRQLALPGPAGPLRGRLYVALGCGVAPAPGLVFFHGGGFVIGDLESHDGLCRRLAAHARLRVLAVDYRLAPAHRFPSQVEDALAAFDWARGPGAGELGFDPSRIAVGGDSAGGNLAAVVAQARRGSEAAPAYQLLLYPWLQLVETNYQRLKLLEGHVISTGVIEAARSSYLSSPQDAHDVRASPLLANDLAGLAPAHIVTCGLDPLNHEGRAYAARLNASGVSARHVHFDRMPHGFMQYPGLFSEARRAIEAAGVALAAALDRAPA